MGLADRRQRRQRCAPPPAARHLARAGPRRHERQREVLFLRYYADLDYATIAAALGISAGTVGATLSTARGVLRRALTPEVKA